MKKYLVALTLIITPKVLIMNKWEHHFVLKLFVNAFLSSNFFGTLLTKGLGVAYKEGKY